MSPIFNVRRNGRPIFGSWLNPSAGNTQPPAGNAQPPTGNAHGTYTGVFYRTANAQRAREMQRTHSDPRQAGGDVVVLKVETLTAGDNAVNSICHWPTDVVRESRTVVENGRTNIVQERYIFGLAINRIGDQEHPAHWTHTIFDILQQLGNTQKCMPRLDPDGSVIHIKSHKRDGYEVLLELDQPEAGKQYRYAVCFFTDEREFSYYASGNIIPPEEVQAPPKISDPANKAVYRNSRSNTWDGKRQVIFMPFYLWKNRNGRDRPFLAVAISDDGTTWHYFKIDPQMPEPTQSEDPEAVITLAEDAAREMLQRWKQKLEEFVTRIPQLLAKEGDADEAALDTLDEESEQAVEQLQAVVLSRTPLNKEQELQWAARIRAVKDAEEKLDTATRMALAEYHYRHNVALCMEMTIAVNGAGGLFPRDERLALMERVMERFPYAATSQQYGAVVTSQLTEQEFNAPALGSPWIEIRQLITAEVEQRKNTDQQVMFIGKITLRGKPIDDAAVQCHGEQGEEVVEDITTNRGQYQIRSVLHAGQPQYTFVISASYPRNDLTAPPYIASHRTVIPFAEQTYTIDIELAPDEPEGDSGSGEETGSGSGRSGLTGGEQSGNTGSGAQALLETLAQGIVHEEETAILAQKQQLEQIHAQLQRLNPDAPFQLVPAMEAMRKAVEEGEKGFKRMHLEQHAKEQRKQLEKISRVLRRLAEDHQRYAQSSVWISLGNRPEFAGTFEQAKHAQEQVQAWLSQCEGELAKLKEFLSKTDDAVESVLREQDLLIRALKSNDKGIVERAVLEFWNVLARYYNYVQMGKASIAALRTDLQYIDRWNTIVRQAISATPVVRAA